MTENTNGTMLEVLDVVQQFGELYVGTVASLTDAGVPEDSAHQIALQMIIHGIHSS